MNLSFTVYGSPQPQGSARAFTPKGWNRAVITSDNPRLKSWRQEISKTALVARNDAGLPISAQAIRVSIDFYFAKPKSASGKVIRKVTRPDLDKLVRGALDSLTGIIFVDDAQVVEIDCCKLFGSPERTEITVTDYAVKEETKGAA